MTTEDRRRLLQLTMGARNARAEAVPDGASEIRPGDLLTFDVTADLGVLWMVLDVDSRTGDLLTAAADLHPQAGSRDVQQRDSAAFGALSVRCDVMARVPALEGAGRRSGRVEEEVLAAARVKRSQIESGDVSPSDMELETDEDPEYQDWLEDGPRAARERLRSALAADGPRARELGGWDLGAEEAIEDRDRDVDGMMGELSMELQDPGFLPWIQHLHRTFERPHLGAGSGDPVGSEPLSGGPSATGPAADVDSWGMVFHDLEEHRVREVLEPLLAHRRNTVGAARTMILDYRSGEGRRAWAARHGVPSGAADPTKIPRFLLLVGPPSGIPFEFQSELSLEYAVGRLSLTTPEAYGRFVDGLIRFERDPRAPSHPGARLALRPDTPSAARRRVISWLAATARELMGRPAGSVLRGLKRREVELSIRLHQLNEKKSLGARFVDEELLEAWQEREAIRCLIVLGDPAARLTDPTIV